MTARSLHRVYRIGGTRHAANVRLEDGQIVGTVDGAPVRCEAERGTDGEITLRIGKQAFLAVVARKGAALWVAVDGRTHEFVAADPAAAERAAPPADPFAASPMAGLLVKVPVAAGGAVPKGGVLFVVEAMKTEYVVAADRDVTVGEVKRRPGERVDLGEVIVTFRGGGP